MGHRLVFIDPNETELFADEINLFGQALDQHYPTDKFETLELPENSPTKAINQVLYIANISEYGYSLECDLDFTIIEIEKTKGTHSFQNSNRQSRSFLNL